MFLGIGPTSAVDAYLRDVPIDVIEQIDWPGAARTTSVPGTRRPPHRPAAQPFWVDLGDRGGPVAGWEPHSPATGPWWSWPSEPRRSVNVTVTGSVTIPILGPLGFVVLAIAPGGARARRLDHRPRRRGPPLLADLLRRLVEIGRSSALARVPSAITAIVAPTVDGAAERSRPAGSPRPARSTPAPAVITGDTWVISADSHDATCLCDQITSVCPTNPGKTATVMTAREVAAGEARRHAVVTSANGVIVSAPASITQAK